MYKPTDNVFIVATGHSLRGFDFGQLKGQKVIAVNEAACYVDYDYCMAIDIEVIMNKPILVHRIPAMCKGPVITTHEVSVSHPFDLIVMLSSGAEGFDFTPNRIKTAGNSGYSAINAAYHLGARKVFLLGFDLGLSDTGDKYFYDWVDQPGVHPDYLYINYFYDTMAADLEGSDMKVFN